MSNFIYDNLALPATKTDVRAPTDPTHQWAAADANTIFQYLSDTRSAILSNVFIVKQFASLKPTGILGDGTDDSPAIQGALNAAASVHADGTYGGVVLVPGGVYNIGTPLSGANGIILRGSGTPTTILRCMSTFSAASLIHNSDQTGNQEFFSMEEITLDGNQQNGAQCTTAVLDLGSIFINSFFRNMEIINGSNVGLHVAAANAMGPIYFENVWVANCIGHNVLCEELAGNSGACDGLCFVNLTSEHQGSGKSAIYLKGLGSASQWSFFNTHVEMGQGGASAQTGITIDGVSDVLFDGIQLLTGSVPAITAGITITTAVQNVRIQMRAISNANLMPLVNDVKNSLTVGTVGSLPWFVTPEVLVRGGLRFTPHTVAGSKSAVFQNSAGTDRAWFDDTGVLTGNSPTSAGCDVGSNTPDGASTGRVLALINQTRSRAFGYYYPDSSFIRFRGFTAGVDAWDVDNSGNFRTWNTTSLGVNGGATVVTNALRYLSEVVPAQITVSQNDYNPANLSLAVILLVNSSGAVNITGLTNNGTGREIYVYNTGASNITLTNQDVSSLAANRFIGVGNANTTLTPGTGRWVYYSPSLTRWIVQ
jgi:hypothetical protein